MSEHLDSAQCALLREHLDKRRAELGRRMAEHHGGMSRAEHARTLQEQDAGDVPLRESEREFDLAMSDLEAQELRDVGEALRRLDDGRYGRCEDCDEPIPFGRLRVEPWALLCVGCAARRERAAGKRSG